MYNETGIEYPANVEEFMYNKSFGWIPFIVEERLVLYNTEPDWFGLAENCKQNC